jgi:hypothetical protein
MGHLDDSSPTFVAEADAPRMGCEQDLLVCLFVAITAGHAAAPLREDCGNPVRK